MLGLIAGRTVAAVGLATLPFDEVGLGQLPTVVGPATVAASGLGILAALGGAAVPAVRTCRQRPISVLVDAPLPAAARPLRRSGRGGHARLDARAAVPILLLSAAIAAGKVSVDRAGVLTTAGTLSCALAAVLLSGGLTLAVTRTVTAAIGAARGRRAVERAMTVRLAQRSAEWGERRLIAAVRVLVLAVGFASAVLVLGSTVRASASATLEEQVHADLTLSGRLAPGLAERIEALPEIDRAVGFTHGAMGVPTLDGPQELWAADLSGLGTVIDLGTVVTPSGPLPPGAPLPRDGVLLHIDEAHRLGVQPGDRLPVVFNRTGPTQLVVAATYTEASLFDGFLADRTVFATFESDARDRLLAMTLRPGTDREVARAAVRTISSEYPSIELWDDGEFAAATGAQVDQVLAIVGVLLALGLGAAVIAVVTTMAGAVLERGRELGLLRVVGMTLRQLRRCVRVETAAAGIVCGGAGIAIGFAVGLLVRSSLPDAWARRLDIPVTAISLLGVAAVALTVMAGALPARLLGRRPLLAGIGDRT